MEEPYKLRTNNGKFFTAYEQDHVFLIHDRYESLKKGKDLYRLIISLTSLFQRSQVFADGGGKHVGSLDSPHKLEQINLPDRLRQTGYQKNEFLSQAFISIHEEIPVLWLVEKSIVLKQGHN